MFPVDVAVWSHWAVLTLHSPLQLQKFEEMKTQSKQYTVYQSNLHKPPTVFQTNSTSYSRQLFSVFTFSQTRRQAFEMIHVKTMESFFVYCSKP